MVRELDRVRHESGSTSAELSSQTQPLGSFPWSGNPTGTTPQLDFPATAPTANPVFFRTYSRFTATGRETWQQVCTRTLEGLVKLGKLTDAEADIIDRMQRQVKAMPSGRWLWVGGSEWLEQPQNFSGAYNCTSTNVCDWAAFALMMDLAMMGCGTGAILEPDLIGKLPVVRNQLKIAITSEIGGVPIASRQELSTVEIADNKATIRVGDSRQGWVNSYKILLELSSDDRFNGEVNVSIDLSNVRPAGEQLKGFGGMANPVRLPELYGRCAGILNKANGRQLNSVECCLLIDEAAVTIVAGNIRRCLPAGALVHAESGLVPIEKIRIGDRVLTSKGFYPVTNFFDQGEQSLCRIKTQDSYFECTADHKVAVLTDIYGNYEMVKAKDLQPNDRLVFVPQSIPGTPTELPEFKGQLAPHSKRITVPALTPDVAYFIGYLHGDGSVASDGWRVRFRVAEHQQQILEKLISVGESFGLDTHTLTTPEQCKAKAFELQFNSSALNQYLSKFKQPFTSISVPDSILLGTQAIREAYLAGLADADGCYSQGGLVASVHADFLRQIQTIYASIGITTRLCSSVRKRTGKWEGELVTVGSQAFDDTASIFNKHSVVFADKQKERPKSFKDHGFPKEMVRPLINTYRYGWSNHQEQMIVPTLKKFIPEATDLIPVKVESVEFDVRTSHTYDIEVASIHEFVCEGILVSNSAGMRQFNAGDTLGATAKDNLWQQDERGNWRIDPERDALRMSNHTRVFHHKPTLEECVAAVQKQYYSGEGAIQWAGEAVARSNADLLNTPEKKKHFIDLYGQSQDLAKGYLRDLLVAQKNQAKEKM
jgi:ribonucleotide reductase, class II